MSVLYSKLLQYIILPIGDVLSGSAVMRSFYQLNKEVKLNENDLLKLQQRKLNKLITYATDKCSYYRGLDIKYNENSNFIEVLKTFPILSKDILKGNPDGLISIQNKKLYAQKSSGSTGMPTTVYWVQKEFNRYRATTILWWTWAGFSFGDYILQTGMPSDRPLIKRIKDKLFKTYYLRAYNHNQEELENAVDWLKNKKDPVIGGFASSLYIIAKYCKENGIKKKVKTCISWGDKLFDKYKSCIKEVFDCEVYETYGSSEGFLIASQKDLDYMYIMSPNIYLEVVDDFGNEVEEGEIGHVLVTNLNNFAMPLIRYRLGDLAIKLPRNKYPAKRDLALPLLQKVIGRDTDIVRTPKGKQLSVHSFNSVLEHFEYIKQFQIVQHNISQIEVRLIGVNKLEDNEISEVETALNLMIKEDGFNIKFKVVESIEPSKSGKPEMVISYLDKK